MQTVVAFPGTAAFGQQVALAFHEVGSLSCFLTAFAYQDSGALARIVRTLPGTLRIKLERELSRRTITSVPDDKIEQRALWEVLRTAGEKLRLDAKLVDRTWDRLSHDFTRHLARKVKPGVDAVYAYEYTALEAFERADHCGVARILDFPSLDSRQFEELQRLEKSLHPGLTDPNETYFSAVFEQRQGRRDREAALADVVIVNSSVTRASHIAAGIDPDKIISVPYGAPEPIASIRQRELNGPLKVVWAGTFSIRKGAHHFVEAWRRLAASREATADIFGAVALPQKLWSPQPEGMCFRGSIPRPALFDAFENADVLMFPTLSDGFGMVVTEAFARGLPVITTRQAGAQDLVDNGRNGLIITPGEPEAITEALRWCLANRTRLAAMRHEALSTARGWQWSDYRRALIRAVDAGLARAGYEPHFSAFPVRD